MPANLPEITPRRRYPLRLFALIAHIWDESGFFLPLINQDYRAVVNFSLAGPFSGPKSEEPKNSFNTVRYKSRPGAGCRFFFPISLFTPFGGY